ncbi:hypothetical protein PIB30_065819 [Stylosanthes scabra]|uniref:Uncharacterized protein n=1 Tax=Stylosanthes scabra TaxID=79078 RepID=A0ABU6WQ58_9FABA|nr:hypothetical protein [Stylosanthes scabra]
MVEGTPLDNRDELPMYDGISSGYGWSILAWQFWNGRGTSEQHQQKFRKKIEEDQEIKHKIASQFSKEELEEDTKFEEKLDLHLECSDPKATKSVAEENAITGVEVNAIVKEEGDNTMKEGSIWFQIGNEDGDAMNEGGAIDSAGVLHDGATATQKDELRVTNRPMMESSSSVEVL